MQLLSPDSRILPGLELDLWGCNPVKGPLCPVLVLRRLGTGYPTASGSPTDPVEPALIQFRGERGISGRPGAVYCTSRRPDSEAMGAEPQCGLGRVTVPSHS